jgi:acyl-CoA hydrolase
MDECRIRNGELNGFIISADEAAAMLEDGSIIPTISVGSTPHFMKTANF